VKEAVSLLVSERGSERGISMMMSIKERKQVQVNIAIQWNQPGEGK